MGKRCMKELPAKLAELHTIVMLFISCLSDGVGAVAISMGLKQIMETCLWELQEIPLYSLHSYEHAGLGFARFQLMHTVGSIHCGLSPLKQLFYRCQG